METNKAGMGMPSPGGVLPGIISVPAKPMKAPTPAPNGTGMPSGEIDPFIGAGGGKKPA